MLEPGTAISWPVSKRDLKLWLEENFPVILVVYDGRHDRAYWLDVQAYFLSRPAAEFLGAGETVHVHVPVRARLGRRSLHGIARLKRDVQSRLRQKGRRHG